MAWLGKPAKLHLMPQIHFLYSLAHYHGILCNVNKGTAVGPLAASTFY